MVWQNESRAPFDRDAADNNAVANALNFTMTEALAQRDMLNYKAGYQHGHDNGYSRGLREGLAQGPNHPAVIRSVANMFGDWDGAQAARERSRKRFWHEYEAANGGDGS